MCDPKILLNTFVILALKTINANRGDKCPTSEGHYSVVYSVLHLEIGARESLKILKIKKRYN